ncbi:hypothetical protein QQS21_000450, partial [Conoideocrella luteorostrata]
MVSKAIILVAFVAVVAATPIQSTPKNTDAPDGAASELLYPLTNNPREVDPRRDTYGLGGSAVDGWPTHPGG